MGNSTTGVYVKVLKVFLEGKQVLQTQYGKSSDKTYTFDGWSHGSDSSTVRFANWTALNSKSILTSPVVYFDKTFNTLAALQFTELQFNSSTNASAFTSVSWLFLPFQSEPINLGIQNTTRSAAIVTQLNSYNKFTETQTCVSTVSPSTTIVGFANTQNNSAITSLQPLYYSTSASVCACLVTSANVINVTSSYSEPYTGRSIILRIIASGKSV